MTGNQLIDYINKFGLGNYPVMVGCEGYTNANDSDNETRVEFIDGNIVIHDTCDYGTDKT